MQKIILIILALVSGVMYSQPIKSVLAARSTDFIEEQEIEPIPEGMTAVEYIEMTAGRGCYFDSGLPAYETDRVVLDSELLKVTPSTGGDCFIVFCNNTYFLSNYSQNTFYIRFGSTSSKNQYAGGLFGCHIYELYLEHFDIDGRTYQTPVYNTVVGGTWLFGRSVSASSNAQAVRHHSIKIIDNSTGEIRMWLIPVRTDDGDEGFFYDKVSGEVFGSQGTVPFIAGPDL